MHISLGQAPPTAKSYRTVLPRPSKLSPEERGYARSALKVYREVQSPDLLRAYVMIFAPKFISVLEADPEWMAEFIMADEMSFYVGGVLVSHCKEENEETLETLYAKIKANDGDVVDLLNECLTLCSMAPLERGDLEYQESLLRGLFYTPPR